MEGQAPRVPETLEQENARLRGEVADLKEENEELALLLAAHVIEGRIEARHVRERFRAYALSLPAPYGRCGVLDVTGEVCPWPLNSAKVWGGARCHAHGKRKDRGNNDLGFVVPQVFRGMLKDELRILNPKPGTVLSQAPTPKRPRNLSRSAEKVMASLEVQNENLAPVVKTA